jgi:coiled-coil domain-containing protein 12
MESAAERKARLKALRAAAEESGVVAARDPADECVPGCACFTLPRLRWLNTPPLRRPEAKALKFRNYVPKDTELREAKARALQSASAGPQLTRSGRQIAEAHAQEPEVPVVEPPPEEDAQEGLLSVQPKKANWDLRRDVERKLEKLEKRTQRALAELMRQEDAKRTAGQV